MRDDVEFYKKGWLAKSLIDFDYNKKFNETIKKYVQSFYEGDSNLWIKSYSGAFDFYDDDLFINFCKSNNLENLISNLTHQDYKLGNVFLRMWIPGKQYLNWHRDTYFRGDELTGRFPADVSIFFYPFFFKYLNPQLLLIEKSQRLSFDNNFLEKIQCRVSRVTKIYNSNQKIYIINNGILHGLPNLNKNYKKEKKEIIKQKPFIKSNINYAYPRLIMRFCSSRNLNTYRLGSK